MDRIWLVTITDAANFDNIGAQKAFAQSEAGQIWGQMESAMLNEKDEFKGWDYSIECVPFVPHGKES